MIKKNRIFKKIFTILLLCMLSFSLTFSIYHIQNQQKQILHSLEIEAKNVASMIIHITQDAIVLNDNSFIIEFNQSFIGQNNLLKTIIINRQDKDYYIIKKDSWSFENSIDEHIKEHEKSDFSSGIMKSPILKEFVFHYDKPIIIAGVKWGYLHLSFSLEDYNNKINQMYYSFFIFFSILLFMIFLISYFVAKGLSRPIEQLNSVANEISSGNLELRSIYKSDDELGELSKSFNNMISKIQSSQDQLKLYNDKLEDRVEKRTLELNRINSELEILNKCLDEKVRDEVEKRTKQEKLFIHQSRLAAIGELISNIAHQWRQPLSVITVAASGIRLEKEFGVSNVQGEIEKLNSIEEQSKYLSTTIANLDSFFKTTNSRMEFNIRRKFEEAFDLNASSLSFHKIETIKELEDEVIIDGLANEYSQVIMNILANAKDTLVQREIKTPKIYIKLYKKDGYSFLEIEDNAGGIDSKIIDKIFDPYFTTKHQAQGVGIGLYMCKIIIEKNMDGELFVENTNRGAKFTIKVQLS